MFLTYVNDMANDSPNLFLLKFADDSHAFVHGKNGNALCATINENLEMLQAWLNANKLCLNVTKTNYTLIRLKNRTCCTELLVKINNEYVAQLNKIKFL